MKKLLLTLIIAAASFAGFAQVAVNTDGSLPNTHAMLDVQSSDKGMLIPRMTTIQRITFGITLGTSDVGMMVFDTDLQRLFVFDGSNWVSTAALWIHADSNNIVFNNTDSIGIATSTPGAELDVHGHIWQTGTGNSVFLGESAGAGDDYSNNKNVFIGKGTGFADSTGYENVALGHEALHKNKTGNKNIAIGNRAQFWNSKNPNLIAIGDSALFRADSGYYIGYENQPWFATKLLAIGNSVSKWNTGGKYSTIIGHYDKGWEGNSLLVGDSALISGKSENSIVIGNKAFFENIHVDFYPHESVIIGNRAMYHFGNWLYDGTYSDFSQNTVIGNRAFYDLTWGEHNVALGRNVGNGITSARDNVVIGDSAMSYIGTPANTESGYNVIIGNNSGQVINYTTFYKDYNTLIGYAAGNQLGFDNVAIGYKALGEGHTNLKNKNVAIGAYALAQSDTSNNIGVGYQALQNNTNGTNNIALGYRAGVNSTGSNNIFIGKEAGKDETGDNMLIIGNNTPIIYGSLSAFDYLAFPGQIKIMGGNPGEGKILTSHNYDYCTWETYNPGAYSINDLNDAAYNGSSVFLGYGSGANDDSSSNNTAVGKNALWTNVSGIQNVAIGENAGYESTGNGNIFIGYNAGSHETGSNKLYIANSDTSSPLIGGDFSTSQVDINGNLKITGGNPGTGKVLTSDVYGGASWQYGVNAIDDLSDAKTTTGFSVFFGTFAGASITTGTYNTALGVQALSSLTDGSGNTAEGYCALYSNVSGTGNTAIGFNTFNNNSAGSNNTAIGYYAGFLNNGSGNVFLGYQAGYNETGSNKLYIANSNTSTPLIGGDFSAAQVDINGTIKITGGSPGAGKILTSDAGGLASWETSPVSAGRSIDTHSDVDVSTTSPVNGQVLSWNGTNWIPANDANTTYTAGTGLDLTGTMFSLNSSIGNLTDVDVTTNAPANGQVLRWNGTNWIPANDSSITYTAGTGLDLTGNVFSLNSNIDNLTDVDVTTNAPANGQILKWDGTNWIPANDSNTTYTAGTGLDLTGTVFSLNSSIGNLTDIDVTTNAPANGQVLKWNNTNWVPADDSVGIQSINDLSNGINDSSSLFLGTYAGINDDLSTNLNLGLGTSALRNNTSGSENTAIGAEVLYNNISGNNNTAIGRGAGLHSTGSGNVLIGYRAGTSETGNNKLYIANSATTSPLIGGNFSLSKVHINGTLTITGGNPGAGKVLTSDAYGNASWETPATPTISINDLTDGLTTGNSVFLGGSSGFNNGNLMGNTGTGNAALTTNNSGVNNSAFGAGALLGISSGNNNTALGYLSGIFDSTNNQLNSLNSDIFIGSYTKALADSDTNAIVIGRFAVGLGNNSVVIGNSDITKTALYGKVGVGVTDPKTALQLNGSMQFANDTDAASADKVGTFRYRSDSNNSYVEMCVQTGASSYAWVVIHQESW